MKIYATAVCAALTLGFTLPAAAQQFDGPSLGVQVGAAGTKVRDLRTDMGVVPISRTKTAFEGGAYVAYDHQIAQKVVVGAQADVDVGASDHIRARGANAALIDPRYSITATVRAGYLIDPSTLLYLRGGYANTRVTSRLATGRSTSENRDGWLVGAGVERFVTSRISARAEYRFSDYAGSGERYQRHEGLVGASYHF
jgi:outer membrane immunogenic protein